MCAPGMRPFIKSLAIFCYLLNRAHSICINEISYILYFTLYFLLFVNCSVSFFFLVRIMRKSVVWCIYCTLFCFFCYRCLYYRIALQFFFIFYISNPRRYGSHGMRPVIVDVACSVCVSVGYNCEPCKNG